MLRLDCVRKGEKLWVLSKIRKTVWELYLRKKFHARKIFPFFLRIDHTDDSAKRIIVFAGNTVNIYLESELIFFLDGVFNGCPKQFVQLYSSHVDLRNLSHVNYIHILLYLHFVWLLTLLKILSLFLSPKTINFDFEAEVFSVINRVFPLSLITGCTFHFNHCLWRQFDRWNINKHSSRTNNAVEGWKSKNKQR